MKYAIIIASVFLTVSPPARAAAIDGLDSMPERDAIELEGVTVTAIKQNPNIRTQATAVTSLRQEELERNGAHSVKTVAEMVPNFFIPDYGSRMTSTIYVRGLGARIDQPAIGLNVDNVPVMYKENYDFDVMDIARVEMQRGPQGTLYGRNTMGGVMNIYTLSPLFYQGTRLLAEYGSHHSYRLGASTYQALRHGLGISAGAYYHSTDGEFTNQCNGQKADWEHQLNGRMKLEWVASPTLSVSNALSLSSNRQGGYPYEYVKTGRIAYNDTCFYKRTSILDGLTIRKDFGRFTLSSITSYQYIDDNMTLDQDFTPLPYFTLTQARKEHAVTEDLVARHKQNGYECLTGLFGFYRHCDMRAPVTFKDTGISQLIESHVNEAIPSYPISWDTRQFVLQSNFNSNNWGVALYHQSSYDWRNFTFAAGVRLDYENATLHYHSETHTGYTINDLAANTVFAHEHIDIDERGKLSKHFLQLQPKFTVSYRLRGNTWESIYASVSKGYKAGGFNTQMFSDVLQQKMMNKMGIGSNYNIDRIVSYKPEKAWNYELGTHIECWERRVKSDVSLFYMDCRDRQLTVFPDGTTTGRVMTNAGKTRSLGAELSMSIAPCEHTGLNLSYGYCNAEFVKYNDGKADYKGNKVPYSPTHTLFGEVFHVFNINKSSLWLQTLTLDANVKAAGEIYWNEANSLKQPFYAQLGASATLKGRHYSLELWGRNLTDTQYSTFYFKSIEHEFLQRGRSMELGATLRLNL